MAEEPTEPISAALTKVQIPDIPLTAPLQVAGTSVLDLLLSLAGFATAAVLLLSLLQNRPKRLRVVSQGPAPGADPLGAEPISAEPFYTHTYTRRARKAPANHPLQRHCTLLQGLAILSGLATGVLFLGLEGIRQPLIFAGRWSPLIVGVFLAHALLLAGFFLLRCRLRQVGTSTP